MLDSKGYTFIHELLKSFNCFCSGYFYGNIDK